MKQTVRRELDRVRRTMQVTADPASTATLRRYVAELETQLRSERGAHPAIVI